MSLTKAYVISSKSVDRKKNDYYPTPPLATFTLLKNYDIFSHDIIEPFAGRGWISKELERNSYNVKSYDLHEYENPLVDIEVGGDSMEMEFNGGVCITNPPYMNKMPIKFLKKNIHSFDKICLFLRTTFMESQNRYSFFKEHKPTKVLTFSDRANCDFEDDLKNKQIGGMMSYSWFIWDNTIPNTKTELDWVMLNNYKEEWIEKGLDYYE